MSVDLAEHSLVLSKLFSQDPILDISTMSMLVNKVSRDHSEGKWNTIAPVYMIKLSPVLQVRWPGAYCPPGADFAQCYPEWCLGFVQG